MRYIPAIFLGFLTSLFLPLEVVAQVAPGISGVIDKVANTTQQPATLANATDDFGSIAVSIAKAFKPLITLVAIILIIRSGYYLTLDQDDSNQGVARRTITGSIIAIVLVNVADIIAGAMVSFNGGGANVIDSEVKGIIRWIEIPLGMIAFIMVVITGIRAVGSFGSDDGPKRLRQAVGAVIAAVILLLVKVKVSESVTIDRTPNKLIEAITDVASTVLGFMALIATGMFVYAGILMVVNVGNEDQYQKARSLLYRVSIGIVVIILSYAIINIALTIPTGGA